MSVINVKLGRRIAPSYDCISKLEELSRLQSQLRMFFPQPQDIRLVATERNERIIHMFDIYSKWELE